MGFSSSPTGKESACSAGDLGLIPGLGRCPGEGNDNPLQYSCLQNPLRGAWWATVHGVAESYTAEQRSMHACSQVIRPVKYYKTCCDVPSSSFLLILWSTKRTYVCVCSVMQMCLTLCNAMDCSPPVSSIHGDSAGKNTGVGCHSLLQGIFPTQGLNPYLLQLLNSYPWNFLPSPKFFLSVNRWIDEKNVR